MYGYCSTAPGQMPSSFSCAHDCHSNPDILKADANSVERRLIQSLKDLHNTNIKMYET